MEYINCWMREFIRYAGLTCACFLTFQYSVDDSLPFMLNIFLAQAFGVFGTVVITCYGIPWFAAVLVPLSAVYMYTQNYYRKTSR